MIIEIPKLASSSHLQKWSGLWFLSIAFVLSSLINWAIHHIHFSDVGISSIGSILVVILIAGGFAFILRWFDIKRPQVSPAPGYPLTLDNRQLGIFLFGIGVCFGPAITLYLIACYLAFAPLFSDNHNSIQFDSLCIAITFGVLVSGLIYVLSADMGLSGELTVPIVLLGLTAFNLLKYKHRIVPKVAVSSYLALGILSALFIAYGGTVLVGSFMMGIGDYPPVFFNIDTPLRLTHAHEILELTEYPPESLTTKGIYRSYHYGGPAAAATIAAITGLPVHKSMFFVALPILLIGSFSAICLLSRSVLQNSSYRYLAIMLFLPFVRYGDEIYHYFIHNGQVYGAYQVARKLTKEFIPLKKYNPEHFSEGIWDISTTAGLFLLTLTAALLVKRQTRQVLIIAPLVVVLAFFSKIALIPAMTVMLVVRFFASWGEYKLSRIFWYIVGSSGLIILILYIFGTFGAVGNSATVNPINRITRIFSWRYLVDRDLAEMYVVIGGSVLFFLLLYCSPASSRNKNKVLLAVSGLVLVFTCFMVVIVIDVWSSYSIAKATWIGTPLICMALMAVTGGSRFYRFGVTVVIAPVILIALIGQWHKVQQLVLTTIYPKTGHEYVLNHELGQALATIPIELCGGNTDDDCYADYVKHLDELEEDEGRHLPSKSLIVTTNFQYLPTHQDHQNQITALFGHQAYATDLFFMGQDQKLKALASQRFYLQKTRLSSLFNRSRPQFSAEVVSLAQQKGWTHFLFKKGEMGINLRSPSIVYGANGDDTISSGDSAELSGVNPQSSNPYPIMLKRASDTNLDRVNCLSQRNAPRRVPDGFSDNIFVLDLLIPENQVTRHMEITLIELLRENPSGLYQTANFGKILGVSYDPHRISDRGSSPDVEQQRAADLTFINKVKGRVGIPITSAKTRLWLLSCADGHDTPDSHYFVRLTFSPPIKIPEYDSTDDIPLMKLFENNTYAVYKF